MTRRLTARQAEVLALIDREVCAGRGPPTLREIARHPGGRRKAASGCNHFAAQNVIDALVGKGFLAYDRNACRTYQVRRRVDGDRVLIGGAWYEFVPAERL